MKFPAADPLMRGWTARDPRRLAPDERMNGRRPPEVSPWWEGERPETPGGHTLKTGETGPLPVSHSWYRDGLGEGFGSLVLVWKYFWCTVPVPRYCRWVYPGNSSSSIGNGYGKGTDICTILLDLLLLLFCFEYLAMLFSCIVNDWSWLNYNDLLILIIVY